jgi:hypothetical protein
VSVKLFDLGLLVEGKGGSTEMDYCLKTPFKVLKVLIAVLRANEICTHSFIKFHHLRIKICLHEVISISCLHFTHLNLPS